jgi:hypothetical protein
MSGRREVVVIKMTFADSPVEALVHVHTTTNNKQCDHKLGHLSAPAPNVHVDSKNYIAADYTVG